MDDPWHVVARERMSKQADDLTVNTLIHFFVRKPDCREGLQYIRKHQFALYKPAIGVTYYITPIML